MACNTKSDYKNLMQAAVEIARHAGQIIHGYRLRKDFDVVTKPDGSPVTTADYASHDYVTQQLYDLTPNIPIISEEDGDQNIQQTEENLDLYWSVDPLDGTKNFVSGSNWFYVKISLIKDSKPVLGVVYIPEHDTVYYTSQNMASYKQIKNEAPQKITTRSADKNNLSVICHGKPHLRKAFPLAKDKLTRAGLTIPKILPSQIDAPGAIQVAEGLVDIDIDPGTGKTLKSGNGYSWDYAADALIVENAGGIMITADNGKPVTFDRPRDNMDALITIGDRNLGKRHFPNI